MKFTTIYVYKPIELWLGGFSMVSMEKYCFCCFVSEFSSAFVFYSVMLCNALVPRLRIQDPFATEHSDQVLVVVEQVEQYKEFFQACRPCCHGSIFLCCTQRNHRKPTCELLQKLCKPFREIPQVLEKVATLYSRNTVRWSMVAKQIANHKMIILHSALIHAQRNLRPQPVKVDLLETATRVFLSPELASTITPMSTSQGGKYIRWNRAACFPAESTEEPDSPSEPLLFPVSRVLEHGKHRE